MVSRAEQPSIKLVWQKSGTELDLAMIQGRWTEEMYLRLTDQTNQLIEFTDGMISDQAASKLLSGFSICVDAIFDA
jgi:hypothetical protein